MGRDSPAVDDALHVEHGHDLEHILGAQSGRRRRVAEQAAQRAVHHPRRVALPGVHPRRQEYYLTILYKVYTIQWY